MSQSHEGKTLKELLKERGINKTWLANEIGVSRQILTGWENGTSTPSYQNGLKLSAALNITPKTLGALLGYDVSSIPDIDG